MEITVLCAGNSEFSIMTNNEHEIALNFQVKNGENMESMKIKMTSFYIFVQTWLYNNLEKSELKVYTLLNFRLNGK